MNGMKINSNVNFSVEKDKSILTINVNAYQI